MTDYLFNYLKQFMIQSNWMDDKVMKQARALFTTICFVGNIDADTSTADNMLSELYQVSDVKSTGITYDEFELFMCELIV